MLIVCLSCIPISIRTMLWKVPVVVSEEVVRKVCDPRIEEWPRGYHGHRSIDHKQMSDTFPSTVESFLNCKRLLLLKNVFDRYQN